MLLIDAIYGQTPLLPVIPVLALSVLLLRLSAMLLLTGNLPPILNALEVQGFHEGRLVPQGRDSFG